jgi:hypothetical protein
LRHPLTRTEEEPMNKHTSEIPAHDPRRASETLTIRLATPADLPMLRRLAQLDTAPAPRLGPMLVAEVGGELHAALPLDGGPAIADPFRRSAELVAMLATRAKALKPPPPAPRRRLPLMRLLRPASMLRS